MMLGIKYYLVASLFIICSNLVAHECSKMDSRIVSNKPFYFAKIHQDSSFTSKKSKVINIIDFGALLDTMLISNAELLSTRVDSAYNYVSQQCSTFDSMLATNKPFHFANVYQDSLIIAVKSKVADSIIFAAFNELGLNMKNCFYLIFNCRISKNKRKLYFDIFEYRKDDPYQLIEGYEWTNCPTFYRCYNGAFFKIKKGKIIFDKWKIE